MREIAVLFVCLGNICRSPTAEGVFRSLVEKSGWRNVFRIDSAGTADDHVGESPDRRARKFARARGYDLSGLRARTVSPLDVESFDVILVMDRNNMRNMEKTYSLSRHPKARLRYFLDYYPGKEGQDVPDPYAGGDQDFEQVLDLVEAAAANLLKALLEEKGLTHCGC